MDVSTLSRSYTVRVLTEDDTDAVYALCAENPLFYQHCPPFVTRQSIADDRKALPPGKTYADKYYIGFFRQDALVAVMDLILAYPNAETAFVGFFMMKKGDQGKGTGSAITAECFDRLHQLGFRHIRLGFVKSNPQSEAFWLKNGFVRTGAESKQASYTIVIAQKEL